MPLCPRPLQAAIPRDCSPTGDVSAAARSPKGCVAQNGVHALGVVHHLGDSQVDADAGEGERTRARESVLTLHEIEHRLERHVRGHVEVGIEAECDPRVLGPGDRHAQIEVVADVEGHACHLQRALDRGAGHLTVALRRMAVAGRHQCSVDRDRQEQRGARRQLLAVDVATLPAGRSGGVDAGLGRWHPDHTEERCQCDGGVPAVGGCTGVRVQPPDDGVLAGEGDAPVPRSHLVDPHHQRLADPRPPYLDWAGEGVTLVQLGMAVIEPLSVEIPVPAGVERLELDRVAPIDCDHGLQVA